MGLLPLSRKLGRLAVPFALAGSVLLAGCTVRAGVYDPYHNDRHAWAGEVTYYQQWETDTHRDHRDFKQRDRDEQKDYWNWRHSHDNR